MRFDLDDQDIERIAARICTILQGVMPIVAKQDDSIMSVQELADCLKVKPNWIYKQVQFKSIPYFHAGKFPRFKRKEIEAWIQEHSMPSTCPPYPKLKVRV